MLDHKNLLVIGSVLVATCASIACGSSPGEESAAPPPAPAAIAPTLPIDDGPPGFGSSSGGAVDAGPTARACNKMDVVFVVDTSASMVDEHDNLAANLPKFVKVLHEYKTTSGDDLDYRVAITSSADEHDKGKFMTARGGRAPAGCSAGPARPWLERGDSDVSGAFSCRALMAIGSGIERVLNAGLLSVRERIADGTNASAGEGFLRDDALLAMVFITDEDEGGQGSPGYLARPIADFAPAFDEIKQGRGRWAAAAIAGPGPGRCASSFGGAADAVRMRQFVASAGKNAVFSSICDGDFSVSLKRALDTFSQACESFPPPVVR